MLGTFMSLLLAYPTRIKIARVGSFKDCTIILS